MHRDTDDKDGHWFRSDRYFTSDGMWYFATRENTNFGPFPRYKNAMLSLRRYVQTQYSLSRVRGNDQKPEAEDPLNAGLVAGMIKSIHNRKQPSGKQSTSKP